VDGGTASDVPGAVVVVVVLPVPVFTSVVLVLVPVGLLGVCMLRSLRSPQPAMSSAKDAVPASKPKRHCAFIVRILLAKHTIERDCTSKDVRKLAARVQVKPHFEIDNGEAIVSLFEA